MNSAIALRPLTAGDEPLLRSLSDARNAALAAALDDNLRPLILGQQYVAWRAAHAAAGALEQIVTVGGSPVGLLITVPSCSGGLHIAEFIIVPESRGAGIGTAVLTQLCDDADREQQTLRLSVHAGNTAAIRLYRRFGFAERTADELTVAMERTGRPRRDRSSPEPPPQRPADV